MTTQMGDVTMTLGGRPPRWTPQRVNLLCRLAAEGHSIDFICGYTQFTEAQIRRKARQIGIAIEGDH